MPKFITHQEAWTKRIEGFRRRWAIGWALSLSLPALAFLLLLGAGLIYFARAQGADLQNFYLSLLTASLLAIGAIIFWAWRRRPTFTHSLAWIEDRLGLESRLSAAAQNYAEWPPPQDIRHVAIWKIERPLMLIFFALAVLGATFWLPVGTSQGQPVPPTHRPTSWTQVEALVEQLAEEELLAEENIEELRQDLENLREQDNWFSESSLEAGDTLLERVQEGVLDLAQNMMQTQQNLAILEQTTPSAQEAGQLLDSLARELASGNFQPNQSLMDQLAKLDPRALSAQELQDMQKKLEDAANACAACQGMGTSEAWEQFLAAQEAGEQPGQGMQPGSGGISKGGEGAPMSFGDRADIEEDGSVEAMPTFAEHELLPGDVVDVARQNPQDQSDTVQISRSGGLLGTQAGEGDAAWRLSPSPEEAEVLRRYFQ
ncbi:MAG: hypothetical protein ACFCU3_10975 [Verrucomicrobiales bacterium]